MKSLELTFNHKNPAIVEIERSLIHSVRHSAVSLLVVLLIVTAGACKNSTSPPQTKSATDNQSSADSGKPLRTVRLLPFWVPSAQFAGYYIGIEKGIFKKYGINLEMLPYDAFTPTTTVFKENKADFALLWLVNALEIREQQVDIVNIAQFSSRSSLMLITKKTSGIAKLEDMNGKRAGIWIGFEKQPEALFKKFNLNVKIMPIGSSNNLFLLDGVEILNANFFDEYHSIINNGVNEDELNTFFFADYGFNFLEEGLYCLSDKLKTDPALCADFVAATLESWNYAFNNQQETIDIVIKYAKAKQQPVNRSHQDWILSHYKTLYIPEGKTDINTNLLKNDYENIRKLLLDGGFITKSIPYESFFQPIKTTPVTR